MNRKRDIFPNRKLDPDGSAFAERIGIVLEQRIRLGEVRFTFEFKSGINGGTVIVFDFPVQLQSPRESNDL